jgi:predicted nuclease of predicted toxin-antitoxin system
VKVLIDMNLSPAWAEILRNAGFEATHWSLVGDIRAADSTILSWARSNGYVLLTHDLDFGAILAVARSTTPSVMQLRARDVTPEHLGSLVCEAFTQYASHLERGALVSLDEWSRRARILPLRD